MEEDGSGIQECGGVITISWENWVKLPLVRWLFFSPYGICGARASKENKFLRLPSSCRHRAYRRNAFYHIGAQTNGKCTRNIVRAMHTSCTSPACRGRCSQTIFISQSRSLSAPEVNRSASRVPTIRRQRFWPWYTVMVTRYYISPWQKPLSSEIRVRTSTQRCFFFFFGKHLYVESCVLTETLLPIHRVDKPIPAAATATCSYIVIINNIFIVCEWENNETFYDVLVLHVERTLARFERILLNSF